MDGLYIYIYIYPILSYPILSYPILSYLFIYLSIYLSIYIYIFICIFISIVRVCLSENGEAVANCRTFNRIDGNVLKKDGRLFRKHCVFFFGLSDNSIPFNQYHGIPGYSLLYIEEKRNSCRLLTHGDAHSSRHNWKFKILSPSFWNFVNVRTLPVSTCSACRRPVATWTSSTRCRGCCTTQRDPGTMPTCSTGCWDDWDDFGAFGDHVLPAATSCYHP